MIAPTASGATIVLPPDLGFGALETSLDRAGWSRARTPASSPIVPGEPELAQWRLVADGTLLTYTFNPAVLLRVLHLEGQHAVRHGRLLLDMLLGMGETDIVRALESTDARTVLRGILAAAALGVDSLAGPIGLLAAHREPAVAGTAARVHLQLLQQSAVALAEDSTRQGELAAVLTAVAGNALPLLSVLPDTTADEMLGLQPTEEDCAAVLVPEIAAAVSAAYDRQWETPPRISPGPDRRNVRVHACPASLFGSANPFANAFPMGYRDVAPCLRPQFVWIAWRYCAPGSTSGLAFDGLVHARDHWVWLPKVFDVILRSRT